MTRAAACACRRARQSVGLAFLPPPAIGNTQAVEVLQGARLNKSSLGAGLDRIGAFDEHVMHAELGKAGSECESGGARTDDQDIRLRRQCGGGRTGRDVVLLR